MELLLEQIAPTVRFEGGGVVEYILHCEFK